MKNKYSAEKKLSLARSQILFAHPFYGHRLMKMKMEPSEVVMGPRGLMPNHTAATDGRAIYYNPEFIDGLGMDEVKGLLAHEALHVMLCHHLRMGNKDHETWNKATDIIINQILQKVGFALPPGGEGLGTIIRDVSDKSAEWIYAQLIKMQDGDGGGSRGKGGGSASGGKSGNASSGQPDGQDQDGHGDQNKQPGNGKDGSGKDKGREDAWGEVIAPRNAEGKQLSESELRAEETSERIAVSQAANYAGRNCGDIPAGLKRLIDTLLEPKLPWREILRKFVQGVSKNDYSWTRPNKRYIADDIYLPSLHSDELGDIAIALDTSGSIQDSLEEFVAEMNDILSGKMKRALLIHCDCRVAHVDELTPFDLPFTVEMHGGGGTSFVPPFEWIEENGESPVAMIYFTDGYCSDFAKEPPYPVLWVLDRPNEGFKPPYGDVIQIDD